MKKTKIRKVIDRYKRVEPILTKNKWHRGKTAEELGIDRKTLYNIVKRYTELKALGEI